MKYNWQQPDWPEFRYEPGALEDDLFAFAEKTGRLGGLVSGLPADLQTETLVDTLVAEALKTSEIEGEYLSREDVRSSIRNNLGLNQPLQRVGDQRAQGAAELMIAVRDSYAEPLTEATVLAWHRMIMRGTRSVKAGAWRDHREPMQVVSGPPGRRAVHFEAPPSRRVPAEMATFIHWFNDTAPGGNREIKKAAIRAAIAHLYFETIHPFEDGNGRIGRAIAEKALSQTLGRPLLMSLSQAIEANRKAYYAELKSAQRSNEITPWIRYFLGVALAAQASAEAMVTFTIEKARFFGRFGADLNPRQRKVLQRMLAEGPGGFVGGMSPRKYIALTRCSKATATRDLRDLAARGALQVTGGGRSTRYAIDFDADPALIHRR